MLYANIKNWILDLIFPEFCCGCQKEGSLLCGTCEADLKKEVMAPLCFVCGLRRPAGKKYPAGRTCPRCQRLSSIYAFFSPFAYSHPVAKEIIHQLKYNQRQGLAQVAAYYIKDGLIKFSLKLDPDTIIIPIPLHKKRFNQRGFNQSELIGKALAQMLNLNMDAALIQKIRHTPPQVELKGRARYENVKNAFVITDPEIIKNKTILLVDDVKTTGTTLEEASKIIKEAGAKKILAVTFAH